jgi:hypothetical protein
MNDILSEQFFLTIPNHASLVEQLLTKKSHLLHLLLPDLRDAQ